MFVAQDPFFREDRDVVDITDESRPDALTSFEVPGDVKAAASGDAILLWTDALADGSRFHTLSDALERERQVVLGIPASARAMPPRPLSLTYQELRGK